MGEVISFDFAAARARADLARLQPAQPTEIELSTAQELMLVIMYARLSAEQMLEFSAAVSDAQCFAQATNECQLWVELFRMMSSQGEV